MVSMNASKWINEMPPSDYREIDDGYLAQNMLIRFQWPWRSICLSI
jgi:hypothetical protein